MLKAGIVGASGYGGGELLRLLLGHPGVEVAAAVSSTYAGKPVGTAFPGMWGRSELSFVAYGDGECVAGCDVVFLAQENGAALRMVRPLLDAGKRVIDLSADFRFRDPAVYEQWYRTDHAEPGLTRSAAYGLPELYRERIAASTLVGNPGCYATCAILALAPLLAHRAIDARTIVIDGKSGVSGAGRASFALDYHFPEVNESVSAYKAAGTHRHTPEIEQALADAAGGSLTVSFTPHLIPMTRGILCTCYASLTEPAEAATLQALYRRFYQQAPFVIVRDDGLPASKGVVGSNMCQIGILVDRRTNRVTIGSVIDNLIKGAAGQAIQNTNIMFGLDETAGLLSPGMWP